MRGEAGTDTEVSSFPVHPRLRKLRAPYVRSDWLSGARVGLSGRLRGGRYTGSEFGRRGRVLCGAAGGMEAAAAEPGNLAGVRHIILVLSGKGGVGKSTISTELALALRHAGKKVGILDVDLCGPSIPRMLRAQGRAVHQCDSGWVPVFVDQEQSISLMSVGFLLESPDEAVVWRGPKKNGSRLVQGLHAGRADAAWALQVTCAAEAGGEPESSADKAVRV
ncbi:cytosolic Fe-S cluster assembly factor NUBP2 isoform X4 [Ursus arctos]|uniref:cytosolic Fe-S cluster assembly factor NUBP2 isoform X4 n=1 Tax=Ursus arctos TaxID=9644 RepID=UPI0025481FF0|nr:cytosolic Fe-S cluster assembly factor NUBP2 isoform X4 [Ursus arctos]